MEQVSKKRGLVSVGQELGESFDDINAPRLLQDRETIGGEQAVPVPLAGTEASLPFDALVTPLTVEPKSGQVQFGARSDTVVWWESVTPP